MREQFPAQIGLARACWRAPSAWLALFFLGAGGCSSSIHVDKASLEDRLRLSAGQIDPDCMGPGNDYDACIFFKNPVDHAGERLPFELNSSSNLGTRQTYGIKIKPFMETANSLSNSTFRILGAIDATPAGDYKHPYSSSCAGNSCIADPQLRAARIHAFYWLNFQALQMSVQAGAFYAAEKQISVDAADTSTETTSGALWDRTANQIRIGFHPAAGDPIGNPVALSAEIVARAAAKANLYYANPSSTLEGPDEQACEGEADSVRCCRGPSGAYPVTNRGCMSAISEGQADYFAATLFPKNPNFETALINDPIGLRTFVSSSGEPVNCGLVHSPEANSKLTVDQAFMACRPDPLISSPYDGEAHVMGLVFASVYWKIRRQASTNAAEVDRLLSNLLSTLNGSDNFRTALSKALALDRSLFDGRYSATLRAEWASRGIYPAP